MGKSVHHLARASQHQALSLNLIVHAMDDNIRDRNFESTYLMLRNLIAEHAQLADSISQTLEDLANGR